LHMTPEFKARLQAGYTQDPVWRQILEDIRANNALGEDAARLPFEIRAGLLWKVTTENLPRLCIPRTCAPEILDLIHGNGHMGCEAIRRHRMNFCLHRPTNWLRHYIGTCPQCKVMQVPRHRPYGSLQPMLAPPVPYHTITLDFILGLPKATTGEGACLACVDKFSNDLLLEPGNITDTAAVWGRRLLKRLYSNVWGLPRIMLSDRDPKFLS
jgi:hypothetical protein